MKSPKWMNPLRGFKGTIRPTPLAKIAPHGVGMVKPLGTPPTLAQNRGPLNLPPDLPTSGE